VAVIRIGGTKVQTVVELLEKISYDWGVRAFGIEHMRDRRVRGIRFVEEAVELAQALQCDKETLHKVIDVVYSRDPGGVHQEIGGCMVTLSVICNLLGVDLEKAFEVEVFRVLSKSPEHFAKRNQDKIDMGLKS
jgi:NTP pyrophosphatase (non-canonical NTP hydrolase)